MTKQKSNQTVELEQVEVQRFVVIPSREVVRIFTNVGTVVLSGFDYKPDWTLEEIKTIANEKAGK